MFTKKPFIGWYQASCHKLYIGVRYGVFLALLFLSSIVNIYAVTIPDALAKLGFAEEDLLDYRCQDDKEFFTFTDKRANSRKDIITFVIENGEIIAYPNPMVEKKEDKRSSLDI